MKSVWYLSRKFPPSQGGMQRLSFHIADQLRARSPVTVVKWGRGQWGVPWFVLWASMRLVWGLGRGEVRLLLLGDPALSALAWPARWMGVPTAVVVHGLDIAFPAGWYQSYLRRHFDRRFDRYICISRHVGGMLRERGVASDRHTLIHPGVDTLPPSGTERDPQSPVRLLILGRLVRRKGALWFLREVMPRLLERALPVTLDIVGDGPDRAALATAISELDLRATVSLHGAVDESVKLGLLARCDLVLMPNIRAPGDPEGFGLVALEAGVSERYVLAADLEGLRDAISEPHNGRLLPSQDGAEWCATIAKLCADRDALRALGRQAREFVGLHHSWSEMGRRYHECLNELL
ncbi:MULTISPECIES: glycosyltransferase family 4 protein [Lysobacter]|uniref:Glycosyltransferase family 4 protein n=1 Tax=Lysobacter firmicutimachus TaxID=1792846 RepID=A0ABU8D0P4_9GAMM|nr:glycosyltransferase family 4 protein [Lysobacter antibioticus]